MNQLAGNTNSYHSYGLAEALDGIAAAGFEFVELSAVRGWTEHVPLDASPSTLRSIQQALARLQLTPVSLGGHSDVSTDQGLKDGLQAVELCHQLGAGTMITAAGRGGGEDSFIANMHRLADRAAERSIQIAIEVAGEMAPTGRAARDVVDRIGRANIGINYDTANVEYYGGVAATADLPDVLSHVSHVHLKDKRGAQGVWDFPAIGEGHVDFEAVLAELRAAGFAGPLSVEVEFLGDPWPPLAEVNRAMKSSRERLAALGLA